MAALEQVTREMAAVKLSQNMIPMSRPGFGTRGKKYIVRTNAFELKAPLSDATVFQYDVKITPEVSAKINRDVWKHLATTMNAFKGVSFVYDGRALAFSPTKVGEEAKWDVNLPEDDGKVSSQGRLFKVVLKFTRTVDLSRLGVFVKGGGSAKNAPDAADIQGAAQALNVVVQHSPMMDFPNKGANFYLPPQDLGAATISKGLVMWQGFYSSLRPGINRVFLNVDITSAPMYTAGSLPNLMRAFGTQMQRGRPGPPPDIAAAKMQPRLQVALARFLRNLKVILKAKQPDGSFQSRKIKSLERLSAAQSKFEIDGKSTNVAAYFKSNYGITLQHPDWPCIKVSKVALWPIELVDVVSGQKYIKKLDPDQTAESLLLTTVGPRARVPMLEAGVAKIQPVNNASALQQWGINIAPRMLEITARELPSPKIVYGPGKEVSPRDGVWDLRDVKRFSNAKKIGQWFAIIFDDPRGFSLVDAQNSIMGLVAGCKSVGMGILNERPPIHHAPQFRDPHTEIPAYIQAKGGELYKATGGIPTFLVCFLARKPCEEYAIVKRFGDVDKGIPTQCLFIQKAKKGNPQYYANISMKMNVKLSGTNSMLDKVSLAPFAKQVTMVFGADVTHPAPGSYAPSIAAVVGSLDAAITTYGTAIKVQESRVEVIANLDDMCLGLLKQFITKNANKRPATLIFFRDGVSEGQFSQVLSIEVNAIRLACQRISPDYKPALTYIVCGKRHHMSFFPKNEADGDRKNFNVKAGMCVDTDITSPFQFDWYTQSHASLLGTGRSAHYTVLVDENKMSADVLQGLVFNLCFTYARCTRAVSYATPAYYADRVCTRAQLLLAREDDTSTIASGQSGESEDKLRARELAAYNGRLKAIHVAHKEALYFCSFSSRRSLFVCVFVFWSFSFLIRSSLSALVSAISVFCLSRSTHCPFVRCER